MLRRFNNVNRTILHSKTYSPDDLAEPGISRVASQLRSFAFRLGFTGTRFAVNGILRRRFWVRRNKLWEYARGLGGVLCDLAHPAQRAPAPCILDFGGAATLPIFYLAHRNCVVLCLDIDPALAAWTNHVAQQRGWRLTASTHNLVTSPAPAEWELFDAVISFSVLEHIPKVAQPLALKRLAQLLKPGGILAVSFDFGTEAPVKDAVRDLAEVDRLVAATGLDYLDSQPLLDTGERFVLDRRYPHRRFTFASLFLTKPF